MLFTVSVSIPVLPVSLNLWSISCHNGLLFQMAPSIATHAIDGLNLIFSITDLHSLSNTNLFHQFFRASYLHPCVYANTTQYIVTFNIHHDGISIYPSSFIQRGLCRMVLEHVRKCDMYFSHRPGKGDLLYR